MFCAGGGEDVGRAVLYSVSPHCVAVLYSVSLCHYNDTVVSAPVLIINLLVLVSNTDLLPPNHS